MLIYETSDRHSAELAASAIAPDVACERGYRSILDQADLPDVFRGDQLRSGLLIPIRDVTGTIATYQLKPDHPRIDEGGKPRKYELPSGSRMCLDVPARVRPLIADPHQPLWITEGAKKVDSGLSHGIPCIVGLLGVWNWRGRNELDGKLALADWESVALNGREVVIAFDSDVMSKSGVRAALDRLAGFLTQRDARVRYLLMPPLPDGGKRGLDDHFAAGGTLADLEQWIVPTLPALTRPLEPACAACEPAVPTAPPFPLDTLPPALRKYVEAAAACIGTPSEMVAMPLLAFAGALMGNRLAIRLKQGYIQLPTLVVAIVAEPGTGKTPAINKARWPLDKLQQQAHDRYTSEKEQYEADLDRYNNTDKAQRGERPAAPVLRHYFSTDLTVEALVGILQHAPGVAIVYDELSGWIADLDKYRNGKGSDRQHYLSLWSGSPIKADRKLGGTIYQPHPVAAIAGGIQPDLLSMLHDKHGRRDGFIERVLPVRPEVRVIGWTDDELDPSLLDPVSDLFTHLDTTLGAPAEPAKVTLTAEAKALWRDWANANTEQIRHAHGLRRGFYTKLQNHVARFALILHALRNPDGPQRMIDGSCMADAIALGEYVRIHIERTLPLLGVAAEPTPAGAPGRALTVLRTAPERDADGWMARSDIYHRLRNVDADTLSSALQILQESGLVERRVVETATRPAEKWRLVPAPTDSHDSHYSHLPTDEAWRSGESANPANNGNGVDYDTRASEPVSVTADRSAREGGAQETDEWL